MQVFLYLLLVVFAFCVGFFLAHSLGFSDTASGLVGAALATFAVAITK